MSRRQFSYLVWPVALSLVAGCAIESVAGPRPTRSASNYPTAVTADPPAVAEPTASFAPQTYVYVLDGLDPLGLAGTRGLADQIRAGGYPNTKFGGWLKAAQFEREIRAIHQRDPSAQFVLIGYSAGAYSVRNTVNRLVRDGVPVSMVGYVGGDFLRDTSYSRPAGVQVVNVTGDGYLLTGRNLLFNGTDLNGAENLRLRGTRHFDLPKQSATASTLLGRLGGTGSTTIATTTATSPPVAAR